MKQAGTQKFMSEDGSIFLICDNAVSLGALHDFLLSAKGHTVELINAAQKQEQEATDAVRAKDKVKAEKAKGKVEDVEVEEVEVEEVK